MLCTLIGTPESGCDFDTANCASIVRVIHSDLLTITKLCRPDNGVQLSALSLCIRVTAYLCDCVPV